jgi:hypothetical protein
VSHQRQVMLFEGTNRLYMRRKITYIILILLLIGSFLWFTLADIEKRTQAFKKQCHELNGEEFTYENLLTLHGEIWMTEAQYDGNTLIRSASRFYPFEKEYFEAYTRGEFLVSDGTPPLPSLRNRRLISLSEDNSFQVGDGGSIENVWICSIKHSPQNRKQILTDLYWRAGD